MADVTIKAHKSGPYEVQGSVSVGDHQNKQYQDQGSTIYLCRCGQSSQKPFCDGTHSKVGFVAEETAG